MGADYQKFIDLHKENKLIDPHLPATAVVTLLHHAPQEWSSKFINWDEDIVKNLNS